MKNTLLIGVILAALIIIAGLLMTSSPTGFFVVSGGDSQGIGPQPIANPKYGIVYGSLVWNIENNGEVIDTDIPDEAVDVYFVPAGTAVDWNATIDCSTEVKGKLKNIDADGAETQCMTKTYESPSAYRCTVTDTDGSPVTMYKTVSDMTEGNIGCFAAKIAPGEYDIYM